jgi:hypothetical protein
VEMQNIPYNKSMVNINNIFRLFLLTLVISLLNNCQTFDAGYGPGNSPNSILVIINKGDVKLTIYSEIRENRDIDNDNTGKNNDTASIVFGVIGTLLEEAVRELGSEKLSAGQEYSYYLKRNETVSLRINPIKNIENTENPEIVIKYKGKEKKYNLKSKFGFSKSFSYVDS